jgi:hypothetical protein
MKDHLDNGMNLKEKLTSLKTSDKALELGKLLSYKEIEAVVKVVSAHTQSKLKAFAEEVENEAKSYVTELAWKHAKSEMAVPVKSLKAIKERWIK